MSDTPSPAAVVQTIRFIRRGQTVTLHDIAPDRTLLEVLREDLHCTGTKEGCNEGDCGACTVVLGEPDAAPDGLRLKAVNSCIRLAHSVDGLALWTVQDIHQDPHVTPVVAPRPGPAAPAADPVLAPLHPAQACMVQCHGSQCGFCTPGFVMSLFALYHGTVRPPAGTGQAVTRLQAQEALSGNLCRCTGYRPILDAAQALPGAPAWRLDHAAVRRQLDDLRQAAPAHPAAATYAAPETLAALLQARAAHPQAQVVAGCTDVGLWVTKQHRRLSRVIDVTRTRELRQIETYPHHVAIGAAVTLADAFEALERERPLLHEFSSRFAGLPVRNSGTLGGNVANGSPIGDSMPLLIALGASVVLMRWHRGAIRHRELMLEDFYLGYRKTVLGADEVLAWIKVPRPQAGEWLQVHKVSKRFDDDISAVCLAVRLTLGAQGRVQGARIGAGGVAATPARARQTEAVLQGRHWNADTARAAMAALQTEFSPISDMRASAGYRRTVLANLLWRTWLSSQSEAGVPLQLDSASTAQLAALATLTGESA